MRKLVVAGILLTGLLACETKQPVAPELPPTTTSTSSPTTSTTPTTTTSSIPILTSLAMRFAMFPPVANQPSEMTLLFELISQLPAPPASMSVVAAETVATYRVTGVYVMPNGTTGQITGTFGNAENPLVTGGDFTGTMTALTPSGCQADRPFTGRITQTTLNLTGGAGGSSTCSPSPLAFNILSMLRSDPNAPLPNPPATSSSTSTSTTTSVCGYEVFPTSFNVPSTGGAFQVTVDTGAGCGWSAQSFANFIAVLPPFGGSGDATVSFTVQPTTSARSGTLLVAGTTITVNQGAPLPDLVPGIPAEGECVFSDSEDAYTWTINLNNNSAVAPPNVTTITRAEFTLSQGSEDNPIRDTPTGAPGQVIIVLRDCLIPVVNETFSRCSFTVTVDATNLVTESDEANNGPVAASCVVPINLQSVRKK